MCPIQWYYLYIFFCIYLLVMSKYWGKQIFTHGRFPKVGQKQKTERKKREKDRTMVITMAKLCMAHASTHGARKPPGPKKKKSRWKQWPASLRPPPQVAHASCLDQLQLFVPGTPCRVPLLFLEACVFVTCLVVSLTSSLCTYSSDWTPVNIGGFGKKEVKLLPHPSQSRSRD